MKRLLLLLAFLPACSPKSQAQPQTQQSSTATSDAPSRMAFVEQVCGDAARKQGDDFGALIVETGPSTLSGGDLEAQVRLVMNAGPDRTYTCHVGDEVTLTPAT